MTEINLHGFKSRIPVVLDFTNCLFTCAILPDVLVGSIKNDGNFKKTSPPAVFNAIA
jgi:hypothetical protein